MASSVPSPGHAAHFGGFLPAHFQSYEEHKWAKGTFNRERTAVHELALALMNIARDGMSAPEETPGPELALEASSDHPSVLNGWRVDAKWVYLVRPPAERERLHRLFVAERAAAGVPVDPIGFQSEATIALTLDLTGLDLSLRLHRHAALDRHNLSALLRTEDGARAFLATLRALPDTFTVTVGPDVRVAATADAEYVDLVGQRLGPDGDNIAIGRHFGRSEPVTGTSELGALCHETVAALLPLYRQARWSPEHDAVGVDLQLVSTPAASASSGDALSESAAHDATPVEPSAPAVPAASEGSAERPGRSYRPAWSEGKAPGPAPAPRDRGPSARVRERAAAIVEEAGTWAYKGPVRAAPTPPEPAPRDGDRPRGDRPHGDRPHGDRPHGDRPHGDRPHGDRPHGDRPHGAGPDRQGPRRDDRGPGGRGPERRPDERGPQGRGPNDRGPGPRPDDRGAQGRGPNDRGPNDRGPNDRGPNDRGPNDRGGRPQGGGPRRDGGPGDRGPRHDGRGPGRPNDGGPGPRPDDPNARGPRPHDRGPRQDGGRPPQGGGPGDGGAPNRRRDVEPTWVDAAGDVDVRDHVRVTAGLFAGKVGQVVEMSVKGKFKVVLGEGAMKIEVGRDALSKVAPG